jgi:phospholipid/cholesterol/gamma-HCH transport system permease protein
MIRRVNNQQAGGPVSAFLEWTGGVTLLAGRSLREGVLPPWGMQALTRQLDRLGVRSLPIVTLTALFTGMVLALQTAHALERYGTKQYVGQVVALSLVREMGPVLTALVMAGRVGAGIAAELGTMAVTEQVDAIRALGASPVKKLVVPRLGALMLMMPLLVVLADVVGIAGGAIIAFFDVHQPLHVYISYSFGAMGLEDLLSGLGKSVVFAAIIGLIGCYNGLAARGGADGVGQATTATVVAASIAILISDFFLTKFFLLLS